MIRESLAGGKTLSFIRRSSRTSSSAIWRGRLMRQSAQGSVSEWADRVADQTGSAAVCGGSDWATDGVAFEFAGC